MPRSSESIRGTSAIKDSRGRGVEQPKEGPNVLRELGGYGRGDRSTGGPNVLHKPRNDMEVRREAQPAENVISPYTDGGDGGVRRSLSTESVNSLNSEVYSLSGTVQSADRVYVKGRITDENIKKIRSIKEERKGEIAKKTGEVEEKLNAKNDMDTKKWIFSQSLGSVVSGLKDTTESAMRSNLVDG